MGNLREYTRSDHRPRYFRYRSADTTSQTPPYIYGNRHFWAEGYYVSTVGLNEATIRKYIQDQEKHDIAVDKLSVKEYEDPFKG